MDIQYLIFYMISGKRCPLPDMAEQTPAVKGKYKQNAKKKCTLCKDYKSTKKDPWCPFPFSNPFWYRYPIPAMFFCRKYILRLRGWFLFLICLSKKIPDPFCIKWSFPISNLYYVLFFTCSHAVWRKLRKKIFFTTKCRIKNMAGSDRDEANSLTP